jgi:hypothetical protein
LEVGINRHLHHSPYTIGRVDHNASWNHNSRQLP